MRHNVWIFLLSSLAFICIALLLFALGIIELSHTHIPDVEYTQKGPYFYDYMNPTKNIPFDLVDPETAPPEIKESVMLGYHLILHTQQFAPKNALDQITCNNCHICGGNTLGGKNGGISLVGVTQEYPVYSKRDQHTITLVDRINNCFRRSLNGRPLPEDSLEMKGLINYLSWISKDVAKFQNRPWLGLPVMKSRHIPNPKKGKEIYLARCWQCHGVNGAGNDHDPPLWGPNSFNDGAGMDMMQKISVFIYLNMPYQIADLSYEEALDVSSYILAQPRPRFKEKNI